MVPTKEAFQPHRGNGVNIVVVFVEIDRIDTEGIQQIEHVVGGCEVDETVKDRVFMICRIRTIEQADMDGFKHILNQLMQRHFKDQGQWEDQIVINQTDGILSDKISNYLENTMLTTFDKIRNYLQRFLTSVRGDIRGDIIEQESVKNCLSAFVGNKWRINDIINQRERQTEASHSNTAGLPVDERYLIFVIDELVMVLKCAISYPLSIKHSLPPWLCSDMLTGMGIEGKFREALSTSTKSIMKRLFRFREHESGYGYPSKTAKHDYMVQKIQLDLTKPFIEIERVLKNTREMTAIMEKMIFEIDGYFKQSVVWKSEVREHRSNSYLALKKAILGVDHVYGIGTIYGQLEVHLDEKNEEVESKIREMLKQHMYTKPYSIRVVKRKAKPFADLQHEHGKTIYTRVGGRKRNGTLGGFVENKEQTELYALTCAHVVRVDMTDNEREVYVEERQLDRRLGVSTANMTLYPGEVPMVDISAIRVEDNIKGQCVRFLKDDEGMNRLADLADPADAEDFESLYVYKFGSATNLTKGLVCSHEYMQQAMVTTGLPTFVLLIDSLPASTNVFAKEGDSGSVVCLPSPGSDKITALSMLCMGDFKLDENEPPKCFSFMLKTGLQEISNKSHEELVLCTP